MSQPEDPSQQPWGNGAPPGAAAAVPGRQPEYEFNEFQNNTFSKLASAMMFVGAVEVVAAVIYVAIALLRLVSLDVVGAAASTVQGVVMLLIGVWTINASRYVREIVTTQGSDISHLMRAMSELVKLYSLQRVVIIIAIVLAGLSLLAGVGLAVLSGLGAR